MVHKDRRLGRRRCRPGVPAVALLAAVGALLAASTVAIMGAGASDSKKDQVISTVLHAKWADTPFTLEAAEYLADVNPDGFWALMDFLSEPEMTDVQGNIKSDEELHDQMLEFAGRYLERTQLNLMKFSLALREYSPRIEMFQRMAKDRGVADMGCAAVVEFRGKLSCEAPDPDKGPKAAQNESLPTLIPFDHHHPHRDLANPAELAILYAQAGTDSFAKIHTKLKGLAGQGKVDYVLRHYVKSPSNRRVRLSGYGVELQIKSTEYKAQDDRAVQGDGGDDGAVAEADNSDFERSGSGERHMGGFLFETLNRRFPEHKQQLAEFRQHLVNQGDNMAPLQVWELQHLSMQLTEQVMSNKPEDRLLALEELSQNFPSHARSLSRVKVSKELMKEVSRNSEHIFNSLGLRPDDAGLFINGMHFDMDFTDVFNLLDVIRSEADMLDSFAKMGLDEKQAKAMLLVDLAQKESGSSSGSSGGDATFGIDIRKAEGFLHWINDVEKDKAYRGWPDSVTDLLRPAFPGMMRTVRKNLFNVVAICDPTRQESAVVIRTLLLFLKHRAPTRIGLIFDVDGTGGETPGAAALRAFSYIETQGDSEAALNFLVDLHKDDKEVTIDHVRNIFKKTFGGSKLEEVFEDDPEAGETESLRVQDFIAKTGLASNPKKPQVLMNGVPVNSKKLGSGDDLEEELTILIMRLTQEFQKEAYKGSLTDSMDTIDYLMQRDNIMPSLNSLVLKADKVIEMVGLTSVNKNSRMPPSMETFAPMDKASKASALANGMRYLTQKDPGVGFGKFKALTCWLVVDLETEAGRDLVRKALEHLKTSHLMRLGIVHNTLSNPPGLVSLAVQAAFESQTNNKAVKNLVAKLVKEDTVKALRKGKKSVVDYDVPNADMDLLAKKMEELAREPALFEIHREFVVASSMFGASQGGDVAPNGVLLNGLLVGPLKNQGAFTTDDFHLLEKFVMSRYGEKLIQAFYEAMDVGSAPVSSEKEQDLSDKAMKVGSVYSKRLFSSDGASSTSSGKVKKRTELRLASEKHSVFELEPMFPDKPSFELVGVFDPVSRGAQKSVTLLKVLHKVINARVKIVMNCVERHGSMPQNSYFRTVLQPQLKFDPVSGMLPGPSSSGSHEAARFGQMPKKPIFTMQHHIPDNWLIEPVKSLYDLDNIKLEAVEGNVYSEFELEHLLLEGHCFETGTGNPPRGLQVTLGVSGQAALSSDVNKVDTIVMANLGYLQLKSNPGRWFLKLREGRSSELYSIASVEGGGAVNNEGSVASGFEVIISSFKSAIVNMKVTKDPEKRHEQLLLDSDDDSGDGFGNSSGGKGGGIWNSIKATFGGSPDSEDGRENDNTDKKALKGEENDVLNIFCLASGHLYERLLKIMILTVMRTTAPGTKVKFWILKNYLSPSLKEFLPAYAEEYGFDFEYVQYKWPRWLNQQKEKQRIIWGYKILFLDVLFPLDVKKIIFVDTDQIVLSDLRELRDLDLDGAPYGYTPFCDSNKDMDGFRFWNSGYWKNHLSGRKYHISALYVVDLVRFRRLAAGDRLRGQYQALSQDPNSLSNLDQDLPNNMIHQVPIKSLPQEWLWCETWCDQASKARAKSIDLCNNPLTKESKLDAARRIVKEWTAYDDEIHAFSERLKDKGSPETPKVATVVDVGKGAKDSGSHKSTDRSEKHTEL